MSMHTQPGQSGRPLTGRMVLAILIAFFGTVIAVNLVMLRVALSTFSGIEEKNAYTAGLSHNRALLAAKAQDERGWSVDAKLRRIAPGRTRVSVEAREAGARDLQVTARFEHPATGRQDRKIALEPMGAGVWRAAVDLPAGAWDLEIEIRTGDQLMFRSRDRVQVSDERIERDG